MFSPKIVNFLEIWSSMVYIILLILGNNIEFLVFCLTFLEKLTVIFTAFIQLYMSFFKFRENYSEFKITTGFEHYLIKLHALIIMYIEKIRVLFRLLLQPKMKIIYNYKTNFSLLKNQNLKKQNSLQVPYFIIVLRTLK